MEKRRSHRTRPEGRDAQKATILLNGSKNPIECRVVDISAGGARLQFSELVSLPNRFELVHGGVRKICHLVWSRGFQIGLRFEAAVHRSLAPSDLSRGRRGAAARSWLSRS